MFLCPRSYADKITTIHGHSVEGKIIEETETFVRIRSVEGAIVQLPRSIIKEAVIVKLSPLESEAELAMLDEDYYKALDLLKRAREKGDASKDIDDKIKSLLKQIERQEAEQYRSRFKEGLSLTQNGKFIEGQDILENLMMRTPKGGAYWYKARRALALNYWHQAYDYMDRVTYRKALEAMQNACKTDENLIIAQFDFADLLLAYSNDRQKAVEHIDTGLKLYEEMHFSSQTQNVNQDISSDYYDDFMPQKAIVTKERYYLERFERAEIEYKLFDKIDAAQRFLDLLQVKELPDDRKAKAIDYVVEAYTDPEIAQKLNPEQMHAKLDKALELNPQSTKAWILKSTVYLKSGDLENAARMLTKSLEIDEFQPDILEDRAHIYLKMGLESQARSDLLKANEIEETYSRNLELGNIMLEGMDFGLAIKHFTRAAEMDVNTLEPILGRIKANLQMAILPSTNNATKESLLTKAEKDINWVLVKDRTMREAKLQLARIKRLRDKDNEARMILSDIIEELQAMRDANPADLTEKDIDVLAQAYTERGNIIFKDSAFISAESDFKKAILINDKHAEAYRGIADIATKRDDYKEAIENLEKAISLQPLKPGYNLQLALLYHQYLKDYEKAIDEYNAFKEKGGFESRLDSWIQECRIALQTNIVVINPILTTDTLGTSETVPTTTTVTPAEVSTSAFGKE